MSSSAPIGQMVFSGYSGFCPPLINNWLNIRAIFLKEPLNPNIYHFISCLHEGSKQEVTKMFPSLEIGRESLGIPKYLEL